MFPPNLETKEVSEFDNVPRTCLSCIYYCPHPHADSGVCHRYPKAELVSYSYWCGEFTESKGIETK